MRRLSVPPAQQVLTVHLYLRRWLLGELKVMDVHVWFRVHQGLQFGGVVIFIVGFAWGFQKFPSTPMGGDVGQAHKVLGIILMAMACTQVGGEGQACEGQGCT